MGNEELKQATSSDPSGSGSAAPGPPDGLPQGHSRVDGLNTGPPRGPSGGPRTGHAAWTVREKSQSKSTANSALFICSPLIGSRTLPIPGRGYSRSSRVPANGRSQHRARTGIFPRPEHRIVRLRREREHPQQQRNRRHLPSHLISLVGAAINDPCSSPRTRAFVCRRTECPSARGAPQDLPVSRWPPENKDQPEQTRQCSGLPQRQRECRGRGLRHWFAIDFSYSRRPHEFIGRPAPAPPRIPHGCEVRLCTHRRPIITRTTIGASVAKDLTFPDTSASSCNPPSARLRLPVTRAP